MAKSTENFKLFRQRHSSIGTEGKASRPVSLYFSCLTPYRKGAFPSATSPALSLFKSVSISKLLDSLKYLNSTYPHPSTLIYGLGNMLSCFLRYSVSKELYLVRRVLKDVEWPVVQGWYKGQKIVPVTESWKYGIYGDLYCSAQEAVSLWIVQFHPFLQSFFWLNDLLEGRWIMIKGPLIIVIVGGLIRCFLCSRLLAVLSVMFLRSRPLLCSQ